MIRWEYNTIEFDGTISDAVPHLDAAGSEGWELVSFYTSPYAVVYLMKRPLPIQQEQTTSGPPATVKHNHSTERPCRAGCEWFGTAYQLTWSNVRT